MKQNYAMASIVAAASVGSTALAQNLIVNGGFEQGPTTNNCSWISVASPSTAIVGWQVIAGSVDHVKYSAKCSSTTFPAYAPVGQYLLDMDGTLSAGAIRQVVNLVPGRLYKFSLLMSGNDGCGGGLKKIRVTIGSVVQEFSFTCSSSGWESFETRSLQFTATTASTAIEIRSLNGAGCGPLVDDVALERLCPADVIPNGTVDGADLSALLSVWGTSGGLYPDADCDGDGTVDGQDLAIVLSGWGDCP